MVWRITIAVMFLALSTIAAIACKADSGPTPTEAPHLDRALSLEELAGSYASVNDYTQAVPLYQEAISIRERVQGRNHLDLATSHDSLATLFYLQNDYTSALDHYRHALAIREKAPGLPPLKLAESHDNVGRVHYQTGAYDQALDHFQSALDIHLEAPEAQPHTLASSLENVANLYFLTGSYDLSVDYYSRSLEVRGKIPGVAPLDLARSHDNLAKVLYHTSAYQQAMQHYTHAVGYYEESHDADPLALAAALNNLGALHFRMGAYDEALPRLRAALDEIEGAPEAGPLDLAAAHNNVGDLYFTIGDYEQARTHFERALEVVRNREDIPPSKLATFHNNLGTALLSLRQYEESRLHFEKALNAMGDASPSEMVTVLNNLAALHQRQGEVDRALELYREVVKIRMGPGGNVDPLDLAISLNNLGAQYFRVGRYREALPLLEEALKVRRGLLGPGHPDTAISLTNLGVVFASLGEPDQALKLFKESIAVEDQVIGSIFSVAAEEQKLRFAQANQKTYHATLDLILQYFRDDPRQVRYGLELVLKRKGMVFDAQSRARAVLAEGLSGEALNKWRELNQLRGTLANILLSGPGDGDPDSYQAKIEELKSAVARKEEDLAQDIGPWLPDISIGQPKPQALARQLPAATALVEFVRVVRGESQQEDGSTSDRYLAFVLHPDYREDGVRLVDLGSASEIDRQVKHTLEAIKDINHLIAEPVAYTQRTNEALADLYRLLLQPLEDTLANHQRIIVSPDGELNKVPFAALRTPEGRYLVETHTISYVAGGRALLEDRPPSTPEEDLLLVADPTYDDRSVLGQSVRQEGAGGLPGLPDEWEPLSGTADEAEAVFPLVRGSQKRLLDQAQATERAVFSARSPRVMHLATHGFFLGDTQANIPDLTDVGIPLTSGQQRGPGGPIRVSLGPARKDLEDSLLSSMSRSGLVFAGANHASLANSGNDGILTALEVTGIDLRGTGLVVLSACDTARGAISNGEGVFGLRRAFALAGARNLMMSLWPVGDEAIPQMEAFYQAVEDEEGGKPPGEALRLAQLEAIDDLQESYESLVGEPIAPVKLWAAFILQRGS